MAGKWAVDRGIKRAAGAVQAAEQNAVRDSALRDGMKLGLVVPPSTANPTVKNLLVESLAGKPATQQSAASHNVPLASQIARSELGLPKNSPLTVDILKGLRADAGKVYKQVADSGRVITDDVFLADRLALSKEADRINIDFPDLPVAAKDKIIALANSLDKESFGSDSAVAVVKSLRASGHKNMSGLVAAANPEAAALGRAQLAAAEAVEDQLMRHLTATGKARLAKSFDNARVQIAKTYSVQNALNPSTGNLIAGDLTKQLLKGKPLSPKLDVLARFAGSAPKTMKEVTDSGPVSNLDAVIALGAAIPTYGASLAWPVARIATRAAILSGPGQRMLAQPSYAPGMLGNVGLSVTQDVGRLGLPLGLLGSTYFPQ